MMRSGLFCSVVVASLTLVATAALAQISQTHCASSYSRGNYRSSCVSVYTPPAPPPKPVIPYKVGPGWREDVVVRQPAEASALAARPVSANHCGSGFIYDRHDGCRTAGR